MSATKPKLVLFTVLILTLFAVSWLLSKSLLSSVPALYAVGLRLIATSAALWVLALLIERREGYSLSVKKHLLRFVVLSLFGFTFYFACSFMALETLHASDLSMILATIPAITYLLALLSGSLTLSALKVIGVIVITEALP